MEEALEKKSQPLFLHMRSKGPRKDNLIVHISWVVNNRIGSPDRSFSIFFLLLNAGFLTTLSFEVINFKRDMTSFIKSMEYMDRVNVNLSIKL